MSGCLGPRGLIAIPSTQDTAAVIFTHPNLHLHLAKRLPMKLVLLPQLLHPPLGQLPPRLVQPARQVARWVLWQQRRHLCRPVLQESLSGRQQTRPGRQGTRTGKQRKVSGRKRRGSRLGRVLMGLAACRRSARMGPLWGRRWRRRSGGSGRCGMRCLVGGCGVLEYWGRALIFGSFVVSDPTAISQY